MGLRSRAMISGVNRIHQGPCDSLGCRPGYLSDTNPLIVETVTLSKSAATPRKTASVRPIAIDMRTRVDRDNRSKS